MFRIVSVSDDGTRYFLRKFNQKLLWNKEGNKSWRKWKKRKKAEEILNFIQQQYGVSSAFVEEFEYSSPSQKNINKSEKSNDENDDWWEEYHPQCRNCKKECKQSSKVEFVVLCPMREME